MSSFTMCPGITLEDGTVLGRISDVELFESFELQTDKILLSPEIDGVSAKSPMFSELEQKNMRANNTGGRLWAVRRKGKSQIAKEMEAERRRIVKHRVEVMSLAHEFGLLLESEGADDE